MTPETFYNQMQPLRTEGLVAAALHLASAPLNETRQTQLDLLMLLLMERLSPAAFNEVCAQLEELV